jgi:hypothetical protein
MEAAAAAIGALFGGGGTAAAAGTAAGATAGAAAGGISLASLLQGTATVFGMVSALNAGKADEEALNLAADDAEREKPLETLQGINRKAGIKQKMMEQVGEQDVAYAASGVDLSFGTPTAARQEAFRNADLELTSSVGTEQTRIARLDERASNYRKRAKRARTAAGIDALGIGLKGASSIAERY